MNLLFILKRIANLQDPGETRAKVLAPLIAWAGSSACALPGFWLRWAFLRTVSVVVLAVAGAVCTVQSVFWNTWFLHYLRTERTIEEVIGRMVANPLCPMRLPEVYRRVMSLPDGEALRLLPDEKAKEAYRARQARTVR